MRFWEKNLVVEEHWLKVLKIVHWYLVSVLAHPKLIYLTHPRNVHNQLQRDRTHLHRLPRSCAAYLTKPPEVMQIFRSSLPLCSEFITATKK